RGRRARPEVRRDGQGRHRAQGSQPHRRGREGLRARAADGLQAPPHHRVPQRTAQDQRRQDPASRAPRGRRRRLAPSARHPCRDCPMFCSTRATIVSRSGFRGRSMVANVNPSSVSTSSIMSTSSSESMPISAWVVAPVSPAGSTPKRSWIKALRRSRICCRSIRCSMVGIPALVAGAGSGCPGAIGTGWPTIVPEAEPGQLDALPHLELVRSVRAQAALRLKFGLFVVVVMLAAVSYWGSARPENQPWEIGGFCAAYLFYNVTAYYFAHHDRLVPPGVMVAATAVLDPLML